VGIETQGAVVDAGEDADGLGALFLFDDEGVGCVEEQVDSVFSFGVVSFEHDGK